MLLSDDVRCDVAPEICRICAESSPCPIPSPFNRLLCCGRTVDKTGEEVVGCLRRSTLKTGILSRFIFVPIKRETGADRECAT